MSYAMITVTTKPADTVWFNVANPEAAKRQANWTKSQPGFVTSSTQRVAPNTIQNVVIFDSQENLDAFIAALAGNADNQAREAYKAEHGQVSTVTVR